METNSLKPTKNRLVSHVFYILSSNTASHKTAYSILILCLTSLYDSKEENACGQCIGADSV